jgi:hypothetical protein
VDRACFPLSGLLTTALTYPGRRHLFILSEHFLSLFTDEFTAPERVSNLANGTERAVDCARFTPVLSHSSSLVLIPPAGLTNRSQSYYGSVFVAEENTDGFTGV